MKQLKNDCFIAKSSERLEIHRVSIHLTERTEQSVDAFWNGCATKWWRIRGLKRKFIKEHVERSSDDSVPGAARCAVVRVQSSCINSDYDPRRRKYHWFVLFIRALPFYRMDAWTLTSQFKAFEFRNLRVVGWKG